jgi:hypothetical protein
VSITSVLSDFLKSSWKGSSMASCASVISFAVLVEDREVTLDGIAVAAGRVRRKVKVMVISKQMVRIDRDDR